MSRERFDVAVVIPLEDEIVPFFEVFPSKEDRSDDAHLQHVVDSGHPDVSMIVIQQQEMGRTAAQAAAAVLIDRYDICLLACVGIAGSLSGDMRLGDVCHSGTLLDVLDNAKFSDDDDDNADIELSPTFYSTPTAILTRLNYVRTQPALREAYATWQIERAAIAADAILAEVPTPNGTMMRLAEPRSKAGVIACGSVSKSKSYNKKLRAIDRSVLAIETEAGGVFFLAGKTGIPVVTIRGISDYADKDKKRLEEASKGGVRHLAAGNAASFLHLQISSNEYFRKGLRDLAAGRQAELALATVDAAEQDPVSTALADLSGDIDENLRRLSPEYKLQAKGYRLPLPRIRATIATDGIEARDGQVPMDVRQAVEAHDRLLINLPRTYPDQSLAWVIADDLSRTEIAGRQPVPFVVSGEAIRGRNSTLEAICGPWLAKLAEREGVMPVIIVENIPFSSKHRRETLIEEVDKHPTAKFVFIARGEANLVGETEFSSKTAATLYDACAISFQEIAQFIQKNFEMSGSEAEVVALRLRETFSRFNLDAHPTYFAGIPRATLSALLQANRRSELIQLAVDGFLTFIVAGDKADVTLSRTTRARFLRRLVVEMHVGKQSFDHAQLVQRVREFADQHDFDIDPIAFIQGFVEHGIIHFDRDAVRISLSFIESYLLAAELSLDPERAEAYFDLSDDLIDLATFDLYSEIGPSKAMVKRVGDGLRTAMEQVELKDDADHILLGDTISPPNIRRPERAETLRKRLSSAQAAVREGTDKANEKQKTLDLADRIREATGRQRRKQEDADNDDSVSNDLKPMLNLARHWAIATVLLGSAAEDLEADVKRALGRDLVVGASRLIDEWSRIQSRIDFDELRRELTTDEMLFNMPGPEDMAEKRRFVEAFLDILEYAAMADPARRVLGFLCEQARQRVLAPSIAAVEHQGPMERVIHGTWLADIDAARGSHPLRDAIRALPRAHFLRITLASHYLARVYWNHWSKDNRLSLLDAADEAIKPIEVSIDKAKLKRMVEKQVQPSIQDD